MDRKLHHPDTAPFTREVKADRSGFVSHLDARRVGEIVRDLGAGRLEKDDVLDYDVGVDSMMKPGEAVKSGGVLARIHARTAAAAAEGSTRLYAAFSISDEPPASAPLILKVIR